MTWGDVKLIALQTMFSNEGAVITVDDINQIKNKHAPGDELTLKVYRQGSYKNIVVVLGEEVPSAE